MKSADPPSTPLFTDVWLIRFASAVQKRAERSNWFLLWLYGVSWTTLVMLCLIGWLYEVEYIAQSWGVLVHLNSVAVLFPMVVMLAGLLFIDTLWGFNVTIILMGMYIVVQTRNAFPAVAWGALGKALRNELPLLHTSLILWHTFVLPVAFLTSIALVGQLTGPCVHAIIRMRDAAARAKIQKEVLERQRAFERRHQLALVDAAEAYATRELELQRQAQAVHHQRVQAQLTMERVQVGKMNGTANKLLEQLLSADDAGPELQG